MKTPDLFPAELAAAQREIAECAPYEVDEVLSREWDALPPFEPQVTDDLGLTEDDKAEDEERYWFWDDNDYAEQVCIKRHGPL